MAKAPFICNEPGCGREGRFIRMVVDLVPMPSKMPHEDLKRKPPFQELMGVFEIECAVHGQRMIQSLGHHVSTLPKKSSKKKK